ncbi:MAG: response regulator [Verrucomicrobia bacterium]|nr:response regulator [Verrucomicrobiota bacterium]
MQRNQELIMRIMVLDRENEQTLLRRGLLSPASSPLAAPAPAPRRPGLPPQPLRLIGSPMPLERILVLEDDLIVRKNLEQQLRFRHYEVAAVATLAQAQECLARDSFDLLFVDVRLPDGEGTDLLKAVAARAQRPLVVIITGFGSVESAVDCMRKGAFDYLIKPFSPDQIDFVLKKAAEYTHLVKVNRLLSQDPEDTGTDLLGPSPAMEKLRTLLRRVARTDATVLIQGESGTGKGTRCPHPLPRKPPQLRRLHHPQLRCRP